jgi:hypothetical protein
MQKPETIVIGEVECDTADEYFQFRLRLLQVSLIVATLFSGALVLAHSAGVNNHGRNRVTAFDHVVAAPEARHQRFRTGRFPS